MAWIMAAGAQCGHTHVLRGSVVRVVGGTQDLFHLRRGISRECSCVSVAIQGPDLNRPCMSWQLPQGRESKRSPLLTALHGCVLT